ncbi:hypothetical protein LSO07_08605 [Janthinobacterium sp. PLB04]|uniref:Uncharacterized protein n=1 Tax=Janthinobacterium lividum TaxID=29581 RepID=A0AAJ4T6T9_9BURK|nr:MULTISPECIES: hypothetical protein [Janthinobacterium]KAB0331755.1 hypothetical protein F3B38_08685 [Janthinobacterium lividum]QSX97954.1 hypothetical protein J3P46_08595 [Janthinobacterium lividum]UGQ37924.1 hypothetical protein LSO07_08605 [Janthinobacterium sp. PLB04]
MAITTPLMIEILQHFARVFPMPGRIDGREDYMALVKTWSDQLEPYSDEQVKDACRQLMGKLKRFPYPSDVRDELAPTSKASATIASLSIEVDTISIDAAVVKVELLKAELADALDAWDRADRAGRIVERGKIVDALCVMARAGSNADELANAARDLSAAVNGISLTQPWQSSASHTAP